MANDYSGANHVVLPVLHPNSGEIHNIAVPADLKLPELHEALSEYVHPVEPIKEGSIEYSKPFKDAAKAAWGSVASGLTPKETGYNVDWKGRPGTMTTHDARNGEVPNVSMGVSPQASGTVHTHPSTGGFSDKPSKNDIEAAKQTKKNVWVVSQSGLWQLRSGSNPSSG